MNEDNLTSTCKKLQGSEEKYNTLLTQCDVNDVINVSLLSNIL